jgi:hypothetical protein
MCFHSLDEAGRKKAVDIVERLAFENDV